VPLTSSDASPIVGPSESLPRANPDHFECVALAGLLYDDVASGGLCVLWIKSTQIPFMSIESFGQNEC
jgi:hypothetical protein